ncbi:MAG: asparagine synthase (glutamine-hydrolyzing) [Methanoregula sp.]
MCGIVGFNWSDRHLLQKMMGTIQHRGPDESGQFIDNFVSLGHQRLKIIDLESGRQPIHNEDESIHVVFNGEIYNFQQLREILERKGHVFSTHSDTEVIVHAYEEYGVECVQQFNGMFAFALYDSIKKVLFLARDRIGIKPLYYFFDGTKFVFASEIKAILADRTISREVDRLAFHEYFSFRYNPGDHTLFRGIKKLLPGHILLLRDGSVETRQYWEISERKTDKSEDFLIHELRELLSDSVQSRLISDVPLGVFLSGGLDSASIVALMSEKSDDIKTFSVGFESADDSELPYAKMISEQFGTDHHEFMVEDHHLSLLPKMVWHLDEPIGDAATLPTLVISEEAKRYVTVILAGEGGDEVFAGYDNQRIMMQVARFDPQIKFLKQTISHVKKIIPIESNWYRILNVLSTYQIEQQYFILNSLFNSQEFKKLQMDTGEINASAFFPPRKMGRLNTLQYYGFKTWLPHDFCMKADKMTMAHGLEERAPFLDYRIVNFGFSLPDQYKINHGTGKYLLKKAMEPYLPKKIIYRKKHGYNAPMDGWFKGRLKGTLESLLDERAHSLYDTNYITDLLGKFQHSGENYSMNFFNAQKLWSVLMFEMWYKIFIENVEYQSLTNF